VKMYDRVMYVVGANDERAEGKIRGSEFAGALIDEASLIPESFFKMLLSRLSLTGSQLFCSTNPDSPYHWLKTDFIDRKDKLDLSVFSFSIHDNPSLSEKYIHDLSQEYQGLWYKRFIEGKWVMAEGAVYDFFNEKDHVIDEPPGQAHYYIVGIDYGTTHACVFTLFGYNPSLYPNIWLEKEYYFDSLKEQRHKSDYDYVNDFISWASGYNIKYIYIDPAAASLKQEFLRNSIHGVLQANNDVLPGIRYVSQLLTNGTVKICSSCINSIKGFSTYMWDPKATLRGDDKPIKRDDDCVDSFRYALMSHFFNKNVSGGMTEEEANRLESLYG
jgi:PBSX family phage terminase large subunit